MKKNSIWLGVTLLLASLITTPVLAEDTVESIQEEVVKQAIEPVEEAPEASEKVTEVNTDQGEEETPIETTIEEQNSVETHEEDEPTSEETSTEETSTEEETSTLTTEELVEEERTEDTEEQISDTPTQTIDEENNVHAAESEEKTDDDMTENPGSEDTEETDTMHSEKGEEEKENQQSTIKSSAPQTQTIQLVELEEEVHDPIDITLRIEGPDSTRVSATIALPYSCDIVDSTGNTTTFEGYMAICALSEAQSTSLISAFSVTDWGFGFALDSIDTIANAADWSESWILRVNNATADVGIDQVALVETDELLLAYGAWPAEPLQLTLSETDVAYGMTVTGSLYAWDDTLGVFEAYIGSATYIVDDVVVTTTDSGFVYTAETSGELTILAEADGYTRSEPISLSVAEKLLPISIDLRIEGPTTTLVNTNITLPVSCDIVDSSGATTTFESHIAICALQSAQHEDYIDSFAVTDWGFGFALDSIHGVDNAADWSETWILRVNNALSNVGIDQVVLSENDDLLFTYGPWDMDPLLVEVNTTTVAVGDNITITPYAWNDEDAAFVPMTNTDVLFHIGSTTTSTTGTLTWPATEETLESIWIEADGYTRSNLVTLNIALVEEEEDNTDTSTGNTGGGGNGAGGGNSGENGNTTPANDFSPTLSEIQDTVRAILEYTKNEQSADGSLIDGGTTDWLLMSFSAADEDPYDIAMVSSSLMAYATSYDFNGFTDLNLCAGYPRHILALLAGGVTTSDHTITSLREKMTTDCHTNSLYGQPGINDDVFALFALLATGQDTSSDVITDIVSTILNDQTDDGAFTWAGWPGADITGAAINSLVYAQNKGVSIATSVFDTAKQYLQSEQRADGGWGFDSSDVLTTSWAVMGINALGESQSDWLTTDGYTPWNPLVSKLTDTGYYESAWAPGTVDWFAMKHAVPALLGEAWPILGNFTDPNEKTNEPSTNTNSSSKETVYTDTSSTTTTTDMATSTTDIVEEDTTSTEPLILEEETESTTTVNATTTLQSNDADHTPTTTEHIGGGSDQYIDISPAVAGVKITEQSIDTVEEEDTAPDTNIAKAPSTNIDSSDTETEAEKVSRNHAFTLSLAITIFLVGLLGWRFYRSLL